jgi:hypothetical protein
MTTPGIIWIAKRIEDARVDPVSSNTRKDSAKLRATFPRAPKAVATMIVV